MYGYQNSSEFNAWGWINRECVLKDLLWWRSKIKALVLVIQDLPVAFADIPLGQWFSNYFDHGPEKEEVIPWDSGYTYTQVKQILFKRDVPIFYDTLWLSYLILSYSIPSYPTILIFHLKGSWHSTNLMIQFIDDSQKTIWTTLRWKPPSSKNMLCVFFSLDLCSRYYLFQNALPLPKSQLS